MILIGIDTGGTFTDFIYRDEGEWKVYKKLSTPHNPSEVVIEGIDHIARDKDINVVHGSTVATNAILEKKGAKTALITNKGFEDVIEIGRQNRTEIYNLSYRKKPPLVPSDLRFGVTCRIDYDGTISEELNENELMDIVNKLKEANVESVAVSLLFSFVNNVHEKRIGEFIEKLGIYYSLSHNILAEFREFERTYTTIINSYVVPKMKSYLGVLSDYIGKKGLRIMQSNGGSISSEVAMNESVRTILSGPAGGVVGAYEIGKLSENRKLITFDMGGTSTDVSLIDGKPTFTMETKIDDYPVKVPMIDIHTVGAGGGSIAYIDKGGALRVGPISAGADPGPICYGKGDNITVTDANLFLGRVIPEHFLGGNMELFPERLDTPFKEIANAAKLTPIEVAEGILSVANAAMEKAIRVISVERGYDPREFTLFTFGGAGGMHAAYLAKSLNMPKVFIPKNPGILSAIGMIMANIIKDYSQTVMVKESDATYDNLNKAFEPLVNKGVDDLINEGMNRECINIEKYLDMRYEGQSYEIIIPFNKDFKNVFHENHEKFYGYCNRGKKIEAVNIRVRSIAIPEKLKLNKEEFHAKEISEDALLCNHKTVFDGAAVDTKIINRDNLCAGNILKGPAIIVEYSSTTVIPPFANVEVDQFGNIIINIE